MIFVPFVLAILVTNFLFAFGGADIDVCINLLASGSNLLDVRARPCLKRQMCTFFCLFHCVLCRLRPSLLADSALLCGSARVGDGTLFVASKSGDLFRLDRSAKSLTSVFKFSSTELRTNGESGFLSFAFHPQFGVGGQRHVYTYHIDDDDGGNSVLTEWEMRESDDGLESRNELLVIDQPFGNHQGGSLLFSRADDTLYITLGDGGSSNDAAQVGQNKNSLLGKILRIDVGSGGGAYSIPADNPHVGDPTTLSEIFAFGLRNPFRASFHPTRDNLLYVGNVGQNAIEPTHVIDTAAALAAGGVNLGWPVFEGFRCNTGANPAGSVNQGVCDGFASEVLFPFFEYTNNGGAAVMGGVVVGSSKEPSLLGRYLTSDFQRCISFGGGVW